MKSALIVIFLSLLSPCLAACDGKERNNARYRSGMGSPMRLDATPIKQRMMGDYFHIPANCYDGPLETEGYDRGFAISGNALLTMLWPRLECRDHQNMGQFHAFGVNRPQVHILITGYGRGIDHHLAFRKIFDSMSCNSSASTCALGTRRIVSDGGSETAITFSARRCQYAPDRGLYT